MMRSNCTLMKRAIYRKFKAYILENIDLKRHSIVR